MKAYFLYLLCLGACGCDTGGGRGREFNGDTALAYVRAQLAFGFRIPNTDAHRKTGDWILERLKATADSVVVQPFTHVTTTGDTLRLRNFIGRFRPGAPDRVLYLAHWDTRPKADNAANLADQERPVPGANDGASGVAVLLGVADALKRRAPAMGVDLLFVDGEDYGDFTVGKDVFLGSRWYVAHPLAGPKPLFAVLFDMVGDRDLTIYQEGNSLTGAPEVVERVWTRAEELGFGKVFRPSVGYTINDDHVILQQAGIRAIDVIDFDYGPNNSYWHTPDDTFDKVSAKSLATIGDVALALVR